MLPHETLSTLLLHSPLIQESIRSIATASKFWIEYADLASLVQVLHVATWDHYSHAGKLFKGVRLVNHTPLRLAIQSGHAELVRRIVGSGYDVDGSLLEMHHYQETYTPLHEDLESENPCPKLVQILLEGGASLKNGPLSNPRLCTTRHYGPRLFG